MSLTNIRFYWHDNCYLLFLIALLEAIPSVIHELLFTFA